MEPRIAGWMIAVAVIASAIVWVRAIRRLAGAEQLVAYEPRIEVPWGAPHLVLLAGLYLLAQGLAWLLFEPHTVPRPAPALEMAATAGAIFFVGAVAILNLLAGATPRDLGWNGSRLWGDVGLGLYAFAAIAPPIYGLQFLLTRFHRSEHPLTHGLGDAFEWGFIAVVLVAPLVEELLFRVALQGWLESLASRLAKSPEVAIADERPADWPIVTASLIFAGLHAGHGPDPIPLFFLAMALGYLYRQTHRLAPCVVVHALLNLTSLGLWLLENPR